MHTPDYTDENIAKIAALFPTCVTEAADENGKLKRAIDFDRLKQELVGSIVEGRQERYHLDWVGKNEALLAANAPIAKTLRPARVESVDFDTTKNLYIEGDNLDALKLLQETYLGKVKMIYIDPPYNTGNDFIYEDDFAESADAYFERSMQKDEQGNRLVANAESNGRFHSDWLSMMYSRLKLARNLLRDDGVIFISIDDNEQANLKRLCDEIFGEENFVSKLVISTGANQSGEGVKIQTNTEYCFVFSKNYTDLNILRVDKVDESLRNLNDAPTPLSTRPDMGYTIYYHPLTHNMIPKIDYDKKVIHLNDEIAVYKDDSDLIQQGYVTIRPGLRNNLLHRWRWGLETFKERQHEIVVEKKNNKYGVSFRQSGFNAPKNLMSFGSGSLEQKELFGVKVLEFPKSSNFIKRLLSISTNQNDIILDFFSGSATTAHAVMQLNAEDGGNRQFIMVQLPEATDEKSEAFKAGYKTIAEIGKERIRRAGKKIKAESPLTTENLDTGFRVLKVDTSNMKDVYYAPDKIQQGSLLDAVSNVKEDRTDEDLLFQILLDWGVDLSVPIAKETISGKTVWLVDETAVLTCFDTGISEDFVKELAKRQPLRAVFRDAGFADDNAKINAEQIFKLMSPSTEVKTI